VNIVDAVAILEQLFRGQGRLSCLDAADATADGALNASDAVYVLRFLFLAGPPPPPPFASCGTQARLGCDDYALCR
jgi:hypothetical protein